MWMEDISSSSQIGVFALSFRVHFLGLVSEIKDRQDSLFTTNENEVKSDMIQCATDLISFWKQQTIYPDLDINQTFNIETVEEVTKDNLTGCYLNITFTQSNSYNSCIIPMGDLPEPPAPVCDPVELLINGEEFTTIDPGETYDLPVLDGFNGSPVGENVLGQWVVYAQNADVKVNGISLAPFAPPVIKEITVRDNRDGSEITLASISPNDTDEAGLYVPSVDTTVNGDYLIENVAGETKAITLVDTSGDPFTDFTINETDAENVELKIDATCEPVETTLNGDDLTPTPSGETKAITLVDEDDDPFGFFNILTDTANSLKVEIEVSEIGTIAYNRPPMYVDATVYTYDEYWQVLNGSDPYALPAIPKMAILDPNNYYMLLTLNSIGNYCRFVNPLVGYYDGYTDTYHLLDGTPSTRATVFEADDFVRDHYTRIGWRTRRSGSGTTTELVNGAQAATWNGLSAGSWFLPTYKQIESILNPRLPANNLYAVNNKVFDIELSQKTCTPNLQVTSESFRYLNSSGGWIDTRPNLVDDAGSYITYQTLPGEVL